MRSVTVEIAGRSFDLVATFAAARELAQKVADPMFIAREAAIDDQMSKSGIIYQPKFALTVDNVPLMLWIGAKASGNKVTLPEMQEAVFNHGFLECKSLVMDYLALIVTPQAMETVEAKPDAKPGE
jgi:hypothetical protein